MRFSFTQDQLMLRDNVKTLLARHCSANAVRKAWDDQSGSVPAAWNALAEAGVFGMRVSEDQGGLGLNEIDQVLVIEECGYAGLPDPIVETAAVAVPMLESIANSSRKLPALAPIIEGKQSVALCFEGQGFVSHLAQADFCLRIYNDALHAVARDQKNIQSELSVDRALPIARFAHEPETKQLIAEGADVSEAIQLAQQRAALGTAALLVGLSRRMLDLAVDYAKTRTQFGVPIGSQQAVKHHLANALIQQEFARPLVYRAAWSLAHGDEATAVHVSMAKLYATQAAQFVAKQALQVHGAIGYTTEYDLHLFMKRVWALSPLYGDAHQHRSIVERAVLD